MEHRPFPPNATKPPQSRFPWPLIGLLVAVVLLTVIFWMLPRSNKAVIGNLDKSRSAPSQLQLTHVAVVPQDAAGLANVDVYGQATNAGARAIQGAVISATFKDKQGNSIEVQQVPMQRADTEHKTKDVNRQPLANEPLQPGQTAGFLVSYSQVPSNWNHQPPDLTVMQVTEKK